LRQAGLHRGLTALLFAGAGLFLADSSGTAADELPVGAGFDFYVLSLSWSPSYCAAEGEDANRQQCGGDRSYGFIVHGLWPQFERGYPENCRTNQPLDVPRDQLAALYDIMPSAGLIRHQWRKHGSCAGLSQQDYFAVLRAAWEQVAVPESFREASTPVTVDPDAVEAAFIAANPGLPEDGITVTCDRRRLREVRICMAKTLDFRSCEEVDRRMCRQPSVLVPASR
jgi:ribonuclease T2